MEREGPALAATWTLVGAPKTLRVLLANSSLPGALRASFHTVLTSVPPAVESWVIERMLARRPGRPRTYDGGGGAIVYLQVEMR